MNLLDQLTSQLGGQNLKALSGQLGLSESQTQSGIGAALPMLMGALAKNTSTDDGANTLGAALDRDHDGSIMNDLGGFLSSADNGPGPGIVNHVFGAKRAGAETGVAQLSGLDAGTAGKLMENLAPVVMGALGQEKRRGGLDAGGLANVLGQEREHAAKQSSGAMGLVSSLLDQDGDGSVIDDIAGIAGKFLK